MVSVMAREPTIMPQKEWNTKDPGSMACVTVTVNYVTKMVQSIKGTGRRE